MNKQAITPNLWFDKNAEEAVNFYTSLFTDSAIGKSSRYGKEGFEQHGMPEGTLLTVEFQLAGQDFVALNGGPHFKFTPSTSFFVMCETEKEVDRLWERLSEKGMVMMPLEKYEWSDKYGWVQDRFGLSWQISLGKIEDTGQKITPSFLFTGDNFLRGEEAVHFYTNIFPNSGITGILKYEKGEDQPEGSVKHAQFTLSGHTYMLMESGLEHAFTFNEAISHIVHCKNQDEIDFYWEKLSEGGEIQECGWLKDKYGISWQIVPENIVELVAGEDKESSQRAMSAMFQMKKLNIKALEDAYGGNMNTTNR